MNLDDPTIQAIGAAATKGREGGQESARSDLLEL